MFAPRADPKLLARERELQQALDAKSVLLARSSGGMQTQQEIAVMKSEVDSLLTEYQNVETAIRTSSPGYASFEPFQRQTISARGRQHSVACS